MPFGEIVCGAPGSGKSTYCYGKHQLFTALSRPIAVVNLDPANHSLPYPCAVDIQDLVRLEDVMEERGLGPNGGLVWCMEYLEENVEKGQRLPSAHHGHDVRGYTTQEEFGRATNPEAVTVNPSENAVWSTQVKNGKNGDWREIPKYFRLLCNFHS